MAALAFSSQTLLFSKPYFSACSTAGVTYGKSLPNSTCDVGTSARGSGSAATAAARATRRGGRCRCGVARLRGLLRLYTAQTRAAIVDLRAAIRLSRAGFSPQHLPAAHGYLARALYVVGDWDEALVHARAAQAIVSDDRLSWIGGRAESLIGTVAAGRGAWQEAEGCLAIANEATKVSDAAWPELVARLVRSAICRARGEAAGVVDALQPLMTDERVVIAQVAVVAWWPILVEGLIGTSELVTAAIELDRLQRRVDETGMDIGGQVMGQRARLLAAKGDPDEAASQFQLAIEAIRPDDPLVDRALLRHHYGRLLHARGNRRDAVDYLRAAHEMFAGVGAEPYRKAVAARLHRARAGRGGAGPKGHDQQGDCSRDVRQ
jgi:tetratricopeptide (TPR) repeat protein